MSPSATTTTSSVRLNGRVIGRKPPGVGSATPNESTKSSFAKPSSSIPQIKVARSRLQSQNKFTTELRTPAPRQGTVVQRTKSAHLNSPSETPLQAKRDPKSRLPRATPVSISQTAAKAPIVNSDVKRVRPRKPAGLQVKPTADDRSSPSLLGVPSQRSNVQSPASNLGSGDSIDLDKTPKKSTSQAFKPQQASLGNNVLQKSDSQLSKLSDVQSIPQRPGIAFPTITADDLTPKRPMTRARSKKLLDLSVSSQGSQTQTEVTGIPRIQRKPSRVMQIAKSFQNAPESTVSSIQPLPDSHRQPPQSLLGVTPDRRASDTSLSSLTSPLGSMYSNSPNISALAASLSKQHAQRDKLNPRRSARSSVTDMLRYSTMSSLGGLRWEDGAGEAMLTDPDETEAMVADISMTKMTPLKPEVQSAAITLASARANFLSIVQEYDEPDKAGGQTNKPRIEKRGQIESPSVNAHLRNRKSSNFSLLATSSPFSHSRNSVASFTSTPPIGQVIAQEAQLAALSASLEQSHQRELELKKEIQKLQHESQQLNKPLSGMKTIRKLSDQDRERSLVEEIKRLEAELEESQEMNIELENSLDLVKFENLENLKTCVRLNEENQKLASQLEQTKLAVGYDGHPLMIDGQKLQASPQEIIRNFKFEKYHAFDHQILDEIRYIKDQLNLIHFIKVSLALDVDLFPSC